MKMHFQKIIEKHTKFEEKLSNNRSIVLVILFLLVFGLILLLNITYPLYADDWCYLFVFGDPPYQRVSNLTDIFKSQYYHYFNWGGRTVVHVIAQSLLLTKGYWTDILNSFAYVLFVGIIYNICNLNKEKANPALFLFINIFIWFFQPAFGQAVLFITGSANYLWGTLIVISFLYFFSKSYLGQDNNSSINKSTIFFLFGILAGWTNENTAFGMIILISFIIIHLLYEKRKVPMWMILGFIGVLIGYTIMIVAPGNFIRYERILSENPISYDSKFKIYINRLRSVFLDFMNYGLSLVTIYFIILAMYVATVRQNLNKRMIFLSLFFCIAGVTSVFVMIASPLFPPRAWFGPVSFFFTAIGVVYAHIEIKKTPYLSTIRNILIIISCIYLIPSYYWRLKDTYAIAKVLDKREQIINRETDKANFVFITKEKFHTQRDFPKLYDMSSDSTFWVNVWYSKYHGIKSFQIDTNN